MLNPLDRRNRAAVARRYSAELEEIKAAPDLLDLSHYAAICRLIADRLAPRLEAETLDGELIGQALDVVNTAGKTAARIHQIQLMRQELLSKEQTKQTYAVLENIFALCLDNPDLPVSVILDQLRERLFNFRAVAQLPESTIEAEIVEL